ncbi:MAG: family 1 glycosylhydrolase, partial [Oscillospiraceae bacterium]|nr:family 1 glycosylhydrolase [Oscillospiraceae bacterium]
MEEFDLKRSLLLGSTLGGICSDGVIPGHPWGNWIAQRRVREAEAFRLADHWEKWRKDDMLLHSMGLECCRFVLDWARLQPEQKGFDDEAIAHVREEILYLRAMGVRVALVLQECCDPAWFQRLGGWAKAENVQYFLRYVEKIV